MIRIQTVAVTRLIDGVTSSHLSAYISRLNLLAYRAETQFIAGNK